MYVWVCIAHFRQTAEASSFKRREGYERERRGRGEEREKESQGREREGRERGVEIKGVRDREK